MVKSGVQGEGFFLSVPPEVWKKYGEKSGMPDTFGYNLVESDFGIEHK